MVEIRIGDLNDPKVIKLLEDHLLEMQVESRPESCHALDIEGLRDVSVTFWAAYVDTDLAGCGALKVIDDGHAEIKSMRTTSNARGKGVGKRLLEHLISDARERGLKKLSLETGSMAFFEPARKLYEKYGFTYCEPFGDYALDPESVFMTLEIES